MISKELNEKGMLALVALLHHCTTNGNFAKDGIWLAHFFLLVFEAEQDSEEWNKKDTHYSKPNSLKRLKDCRAMFEKDSKS